MSVMTWRRSVASSRPIGRSRPPRSAAARRMTRRLPTSSSRMGATGSTGSRRRSHGTPYSPSSPIPTEQMLRRSPALAALNPVACTHHEKCDGSGYHKRVRAPDDHLGACVLAAAEVYVGLTSERADRPPFSPDDAAADLRRLASAGVLESRASSAVQVAAGHGEPKTHGGKRQRNPGGLTRREVEVLRLAARGLTTRDIAGRLVISPKTADHHIQH